MWVSWPDATVGFQRQLIGRPAYEPREEAECLRLELAKADGMAPSNFTCMTSELRPAQVVDLHTKPLKACELTKFKWLKYRVHWKIASARML